MQTTQLVQASAEVVTITSFKRGDVYKRVDSDAYSEPKLRFGVVTDVMNNGTDAAIAALEYHLSYTGVSIVEKVYDGSKPAALYPAQPEEVRTHVDELRKAADTKVEAARKALDEAEGQRSLVLQVAGQLGNLSAPETAVGVLEPANG